jgi:hypothetical protein
MQEKDLKNAIWQRWSSELERAASTYCRGVFEQFANRTVHDLFGKSLSSPSSNSFPEFTNCSHGLFTYNPIAQQALKGLFKK